MANDLTTFGETKQNGFTLTKERKCATRAKKFSKGNIVYKRDTGMAHKIVSVSFANGIEHYNLNCSQTNTRYFLSKFALESDYTDESIEVERVGLRIVKKLSEMLSK